MTSLKTKQTAVRWVAKLYITLVVTAFLVLAWEEHKAEDYAAGVQHCMEFESQADCEMKGVYGK